MNCDEASVSLGVYLVGSIDPAERAEVDAHLRECSSCRAELADLAMLPSLLGKLSIEDVEEVTPLAAASEALFDRVAAQARIEAAGVEAAGVEADGAEVKVLPRRPRWRAIVAAAAAVVVVGGASATAIGVLRSHTDTWQSHVGANGPIHMQVAMRPQASGSALRVTVSGLPTDEHCRLIAVADDGTTDLVGRWEATYAGEAQVTGSTSIATSQLNRLVLFGDGGTRLVTVSV
ncbi:MAG TPA: zf-HC2 domain-containing protein [Mycobacteriales bacterium]|nr:zf-HC2 domain-containing protein [Mycobacteriales bacterium]